MDRNDDDKVSFQEAYDITKDEDAFSLDKRWNNGVFGDKKSTPITFDTFWNKWVNPASNIFKIIKLYIINSFLFKIQMILYIYILNIDLYIIIYIILNI